MDISVNWDEFRKRKLFVCTPMYGGVCTGQYTKSMMELVVRCAANGMHCQTQFLFNESLITRARNYMVDEFLRSDCTHMLFIDSDIGFNPEDVLALLALQSDESPYDVISAAYPKKCISWEKIKIAVDKGIADEDPTQLERYVGDYVFNPIIKNGVASFPLDVPIEIAEGGTGFMMIRRSTFDRFKEKYPELSYKPDHARTEMFDGSREIHAYFDTVIEPDSKRYLSEDYMFCHYVRNAGMSVWLCPWISLTHYGSYAFGGSLRDLSSLGIDPTAGIISSNKQKKKAK